MGFRGNGTPKIKSETIYQLTVSKGFNSLITKSKNMKKLQPPPGRSNLRLLFKFFVIMKLTIVLILLAVLNVRAGAHAQGSITLNMQQVEIQKVLNKIEKQGEGIGFTNDGKGYYTVSEGVYQPIYYYTVPGK